MNTEYPRKIEILRKKDQTRKITFTGKDEYGNIKEDSIFCTPEEAKQIEQFFSSQAGAWKFQKKWNH